MLIVLIVLLLIVVIFLAIFLSMRQNHKKHHHHETFTETKQTNTSVATVDGVRGVGGHFLRCNPPFFARNIPATDSNAKESKCYDPRSCPTGTTFNNSTGFCVKNTLVRVKTDECTCPAGWGFSNTNDKLCRQRTCPRGWKLGSDDICMLENPVPPAIQRAANSNLNLFDETGKLDGKTLAVKAGCSNLSYLDGGFCIRCPTNTWGSNMNNKPMCVNDTGIRAGFLSNSMPPSCTTKEFKETFVNAPIIPATPATPTISPAIPASPAQQAIPKVSTAPAPPPTTAPKVDPWSWNKWNDRLSVRCLSNSVYDRSYNRCYSNLTCPRGQQRAGELGCGVEASNNMQPNSRVGVRCVCPPTYGLQLIEDRVCKKAVCPSNLTLKGQVCELSRPTNALVFAGKPQNWNCPDNSFSRVIQGLPNIGIRQNNVSNFAACVKCPQGFQPAPGPLDNKGTTTFTCSSNIPVGWDPKDTREAQCGI
jgi:hypothetical protein